MSQPSITLTAVPGIPEVNAGDDVAALILEALAASPLELADGDLDLADGDIIAIAQKIVSKAEGRVVHLADVVPGPEALDLAAQAGKDPRLVELMLRESDEVSRIRPGVIILRHRLGFTSANAGIDRSNVVQDGSGEDTVLLLPEDPDASALAVRQAVYDRTGRDVGVVITDSHGRPFRLGTVGVAIGVAGIPALRDRRGEPDRYGFRLQHTDVAVADEIAAAAGLLMGQAAEGLPVVIVRGLHLPAPDGRASDLIRPREQDLYR